MNTLTFKVIHGQKEEMNNKILSQPGLESADIPAGIYKSAGIYEKYVCGTDVALVGSLKREMFQSFVHKL